MVSELGPAGGRAGWTTRRGGAGGGEGEEVVGGRLRAAAGAAAAAAATGGSGGGGQQAYSLAGEIGTPDLQGLNIHRGHTWRRRHGGAEAAPRAPEFAEGESTGGGSAGESKVSGVLGAGGTERPGGGGGVGRPARGWGKSGRAREIGGCAVSARASAGHGRRCWRARRAGGASLCCACKSFPKSQQAEPNGNAHAALHARLAPSKCVTRIPLPTPPNHSTTIHYHPKRATHPTPAHVVRCRQAGSFPPIHYLHLWV